MVKAEIFGPDTYDSCENRVKKLTGILLIFHPGCGHCVQMRPEWEEMKRRLPAESRVMEIDGSEMSQHESLQNSPIVKKIRGFPSIFNVKNGSISSEFQGSRTASELVQFANANKKEGKRKKILGSKSKKARRIKPNKKSKRRKLM
jgi:hypothetical protein